MIKYYLGTYVFVWMRACVFFLQVEVSRMLAMHRTDIITNLFSLPNSVLKFNKSTMLIFGVTFWCFGK